MLNQEQLAAIAAAMSILQNSMQSNLPTSINNNHISNISNSSHDTHTNHHRHLHHDQQPTTPSQLSHLSHFNHLNLNLDNHQQQTQLAPPISNELHQNLLSGLQNIADLGSRPELDVLTNDHHHHHHHHHTHSNSNQHRLAAVVNSAPTNDHHHQQQQEQLSFVDPFRTQISQTNLKLAAASSPSLINQQTQQKVLSNKTITKPVSYSAVVAKPVGMTNNNIFASNGASNGYNIPNTISNSSTVACNNNFGAYSDDSNHSTSPAQQLFHHSSHPLSSSLSNNQMLSNHGSATNLLGFMGLYVGNLSPDLTKEQLEKIFSKYGEPVKAHRLVRSPVAFIKYENTESPRAAIDDLYGLLLPELTLNQDQPLKLHFDRNDAQLKANYRPTELPPEADNGECYGWRTTVCRRGKNCTKKHIPINRGIDFQMWMIKSV